MVPHARIGGPDGMRLTRAAFAVMVKFSDLTQDLVSTVDETDMSWTEFGSDAKKMLTHLKTIATTDILIKRWESASRMRVYL